MGNIDKTQPIEDKSLVGYIKNFRKSFPNGKWGTFIWVTTIVFLSSIILASIGGLIGLIIFILRDIFEWILIGLCFFAFLGGALKAK